MRLAAAGLLSVALAFAVTDAEVAQVHKSALIIDSHNDTPMKVIGGFDISVSSPKASTDLPRIRAGNAGAIFFAAYVPKQKVKTGTSAEYCRRAINAIREGIVAKHPADFALATTAAEIEAARKQGKVAALIGIEGGHAIEDSLDKLREFFRMGARYMTLTHSNTNNWADSSGDKPRHHGLTAFGKQVVGEMNKLGMIVDISHVSDETFRDVIAISKAPVFASHSSCRAISQAKRNMTDDMIRALAKNGGVVQINFACDFLNESVRTGNAAEKKKVRAKFGENMDALRIESEKRFPRATLADVVAHIDHVVKVGGIDHVGIGSDYDGVDCTPAGLEDYSKFPALTRALLEKGYTAAQIHKIYGGNTLRVMRAVERTAGSM
ncbi:MAG: dipeptidase [Bryobacteraceae bacterium]|nr:dipeptidase [Bryobacteraceae bacterium]